MERSFRALRLYKDHTQRLRALGAQLVARCETSVKAAHFAVWFGDYRLVRLVSQVAEPFAQKLVKENVRKCFRALASEAKRRTGKAAK
jgi:hypothetical protein